METRIQNQLNALRRARGVSAADLAKLADISRQTIYAIEAGSFVPNTEVALKLARALSVPFEELFSLADEPNAAPQTQSADLLSATPVSKGQAVRLCQVGPRTVSIPVRATPYYLPEADAVITKVGRATSQADVLAFATPAPHAKQLVLAGCDPAIGLVSRMVEKLTGVEIVAASASSKLALNWLEEGKVHIAGSHLQDPASGEFNLPYLRREFPHSDFAVVSFARWEQGFVLAPGNPHQIRSAADLANPGLRYVNREPGSGSRALLDQLLKRAGLSPKAITGYQRVAYGHLAAAYQVLNGDADCCLATRSAAQTFQLDFLPLQSERYDFVLRRETLELPATQAFFDVLARATLRRKLEGLAGYDTSQTGSVMA